MSGTIARVEPRPDSQVEARSHLRIARNSDDLFGAFRLLQSAYEVSGLAEPNRFGMRVTPYHLLDSSTVFVAAEEGRVCCTLTLVEDGILGLPLEMVYREEVQERRELGVRMAEVSCLADEREGTAKGFALLLEVMSLMAQFARYHLVDELLVACHPRHARFYQRFVGFEVIGGLRSYQTVRNHPAVALGLDLNQLSIRNQAAHQRFFGKPFPAARLQRAPLPAGLRQEMERVARTCFPSTRKAEVTASPTKA